MERANMVKQILHKKGRVFKFGFVWYYGEYLGTDHLVYLVLMAPFVSPASGLLPFL